MSEGSAGNAILTVALIAAVISAVSLGFTYYSISDYRDNLLTGYAINVSTATVNITVASSVAVNFTVKNIDFGSGTLYPGTVRAILDTGATAANSVLNGTWNQNTNKLVLENIGTVNVTVYLKAGKNATQFIGGTNPGYYFNVTQNEAGSCTNYSQFSLTQYYDFNTTDSLVCSSLKPEDVSDTINISIKLVIPSDSLNGSLGDTITATATG